MDNKPMPEPGDDQQLLEQEYRESCEPTHCPQCGAMYQKTLDRINSELAAIAALHTDKKRRENAEELEAFFRNTA